MSGDNTLNIDDITFGQWRNMQKVFSGGNDASESTAFIIGKMYHIRTVTMTLAGRVVEVNKNEIVLKNGSWIADSGKFSEALEDPVNYKEVEMFPEGSVVIVGRGALIDAVEINSLPSSTK